MPNFSEVAANDAVEEISSRMRLMTTFMAHFARFSASRDGYSVRGGKPGAEPASASSDYRC
jgi:hypothetical protein